jgi:anti-sigma regulatory factor (Ser/Thr protein kinase)
LHDAIEEFAHRLALPTQPVQQFILAVEEIAVNVIAYGNCRPAAAATPHLHGSVQLELTVRDDTLCCEITDSAAPFDPFADAPPPDLDSSLEDRPIGGLGIHLARKMLDGHAYERRDGQNRTTLIKKLA